MTAATSRAVSSSLPATQATAPVLSFTCLYTRDSHKKAKKWHDGIVKYHTFNKRVMVYEESHSGTFVGDVHWRGEEDIQEGDELRLERGGIVVDVGESRGSENTDLSQLRQPRRSGETATDLGRATPGVTGQARVQTQHGTRAGLGGKHRSLNALLGTPKGRMGKATLPTKSPFEERHAVENEEWEEGRPSKRARTEAAIPGWDVTRTSKTPTAGKQDETPLWARTADSAKKEKRQKKKDALQVNQQKLHQRVVIDLEDDIHSSNNFLPGLSDGLLAPSSPVRQSTAKANVAVERASSPAMQIPIARPAQRKNDGNAERFAKSRNQDARSLPSNNDTGTTHSPKANDQSRPSRVSSPKPTRTGSTTTAHTLRFAATAPKKRTLLCQDQLTSKPKRISSTNTDDAADSLLGSMDADDEPQRPETADQRLAARLKRIEKKKGSTSTSRLQAPVVVENVHEPVVVLDDDYEHSHDLGDVSSDTVIGEVPERILTTLEASAIELARLDQMMLPPPAPRGPADRPAPSVAPQVSQSETSPSPTELQSGRQQASSVGAQGPTPKATVQPSLRVKSPLRRVVSEANQPQAQVKRVPGAPVRYTPTPSPTKRSREPTPVAPGPVAAIMPFLAAEPHLATLTDTPCAPKRPSVKPPSAPRQASPAPPPKALPPAAPERPAPFRNSKSRKPLQKSVSLNIASTGTSTVILNRPFQRPGRPAAPKHAEKEEVKDLGPWSREAFDLFAEKWRPPGWDEEKWCFQDKESGLNTTVTT